MTPIIDTYITTIIDKCKINNINNGIAMNKFAIVAPIPVIFFLNLAIKLQHMYVQHQSNAKSILYTTWSLL